MLEHITTALVLCAGFGTRMGGLTRDCPKPLLPVWGTPMLDAILAQLCSQGVRRIVVNTHYLGDQIIAQLKPWQSRFVEIHISAEKEILGTGGGIINALPLLGSMPFFVVNGDVVLGHGTPGAFEALSVNWREQRQNGSLGKDGYLEALLCLIPLENAWGTENNGDFFRDDVGRLAFRAARPQAPYVYGGIQIIDPQALSFCDDTCFSMVPIWEKMLGRGALRGFVWQGKWFHVGTKAAYERIPQR